MSQRETVKKHLLEFKTLTAEEARRIYGISRLAARIEELRDMGMKIKTVMVQVRNRFGKYVRVGKYVLVA